MESFILSSLIKKDLFPFFIVRIPDKSSNAPTSIVYSAIGDDDEDDDFFLWCG